ncbi:MAG: ATP-binding cassette domain-containing protein [Clostridiales bacterium]|jgi:ABC-2 type transport system ATP-binding protein|nr:ATP-binding cassette domain-containing protein [Clostridiales bacterium]
MAQCVLRATDATKKYGQSTALKKVNIEISRGQIYGLIGLNGAGKSTFMRAVTGLISLDGGEIELFGKSGAEALRKARRKMGQSIETPAIYPNLTATQNLEIQRLIGGVPDPGEVGRILKVIELSDTGKKKAKNFSFGMKQRLGLGIALITNPEFLILDEPTNGLDPRGIIEMRNLIRRLSEEQGITLLVSSHILDELSLVATHFGIIHKGEMIRELGADELAKEARQYIRIVVDKTAEAVAMLRERFKVSEYEVSGKNEIQVFEHFDLTGEINASLVQSGIMVREISLSERKLEDYFMNLAEVRGQ